MFQKIPVMPFLFIFALNIMTSTQSSAQSAPDDDAAIPPLPSCETIQNIQFIRMHKKLMENIVRLTGPVSLKQHRVSPTSWEGDFLSTYAIACAFQTTIYFNMSGPPTAIADLSNLECSGPNHNALDMSPTLNSQSISVVELLECYRPAPALGPVPGPAPLGPRGPLQAPHQPPLEAPPQEPAELPPRTTEPPITIPLQPD